jgi:hypothetical protein
METFPIIANASIALLAVIGTFVVFRLQWLRKEIDDYRMRLIHFLVKNCKNSYTFYFNKNDKKFLNFLDSNYCNLNNVKIQIGPDEISFEETYEIFKKRYLHKKKVLIFFFITILIFISFFSISILKLLQINLMDIYNLLPLFFLLSIIFVSIALFVLLYKDN